MPRSASEPQKFLHHYKISQLIFKELNEVLRIMLPLFIIGLTLGYLASIEAIFKGSNLDTTIICCLYPTVLAGCFYMIVVKHVCWIPGRFQSILRQAREFAGLCSPLYAKSLSSVPVLMLECAGLGVLDEKLFHVIIGQVVSLTIDTLMA